MGLIAIQITLLVLILLLLYISQRFWFVRAWRLTGRVRNHGLRGVLRATWVVLLLAGVLPFAIWIASPHGSTLRTSKAMALVGMWLTSAFVAFLALMFVRGVEWLWYGCQALFGKRSLQNSLDGPANVSRRYFFHTAAYLAAAVPFVGAVYGFTVGRLRYRVERVDVPVPDLPSVLDGLRIAQLSDIHMSAYMSREQVRRAVAMANELGADLSVVTGDFITLAGDPLEACVEEVAALHAPLGVWGCLGNHEIYAGVEDYATELFRRVGVRILRRENAEVVWRGQALNLIGVDYQRTRSFSGRLLPMLPQVEALVRRDIPNILLSHNPNAFPRAAELGIGLTLAGHTHGGQVQVEILDRRLNPARFFTEFIAGLYQRPLGLGAGSVGGSKTSRSSRSPGPGARVMACIYVNRGLGTIGAPIRLNSPPEITLLTLRRS